MHHITPDGFQTMIFGPIMADYYLNFSLANNLRSSRKWPR